MFCSIYERSNYDYESSVRNSGDIVASLNIITIRLEQLIMKLLNQISNTSFGVSADIMTMYNSLDEIGHCIALGNISKSNVANYVGTSVCIDALLTKYNCTREKIELVILILKLMHDHPSKELISSFINVTSRINEIINLMERHLCRRLIDNINQTTEETDK